MKGNKRHEFPKSDFFGPTFAHYGPKSCFFQKKVKNRFCKEIYRFRGVPKSETTCISKSVSTFKNAGSTIIEEIGIETAKLGVLESGDQRVTPIDPYILDPFLELFSNRNARFGGF